MSEPREPVTEAGKAAVRGILGGTLNLWRDDPEAIARLVAAIEAEAARAAVEARDRELRAAVEAEYETLDSNFSGHFQLGFSAAIEHVLHLLEGRS